MLRYGTRQSKSTIVRAGILPRVAAAFGHAAPGLASRVAEGLFVLPGAARRSDEEAAWSATAERLTLSAATGAIPVWSWGEGPSTVLLVHGWSGRGLQLGAVAARLAPVGHRVVAFDAPGHGEAGGRTSSLPAFAAAIGAVGRQVGPVSVIVAHSFGTAAAIYALATRELQANGLIAIAPSARLAANCDRFAAITGFPAPVIERMRRSLATRLGFEWEASEPLQLAPRMSMPLTVVHDAEDRVIPWREGEALAAAWPGARLVTTSGFGHYRILRAAEALEAIASSVAEGGLSRQQERRAS